MKKLSNKLRAHFMAAQRKRDNRRRKQAIRKLHKSVVRTRDRAQHPIYYQVKSARVQLQKKLYKEKYNEPPRTITIRGELGIEEPAGVDYFLNTATSFLDMRSKELVFDFTDVTRIWPTGITLLCSFKQWVELSAKQGKRPRIASTSSKSQEVNAYLDHCGFYEYVSRPKDNAPGTYKDEEIVKIVREKNNSNEERREKEILSVLKRFSILSSDEREWFDNVILTEIFKNAMEHGMPHRDKGWWVLAQRHKLHKIVSVCIADNGIGIRNSLKTGPQKDAISIDDSPANDGEFIKLALQGNVSGALNAPLKTGIGFRKFEPGSRRGNGLKRIRETCANLGIPWTILSHNGFVFLDRNGNIIRYGARDNRVFSGTLIHLTVRAN